MTRWNLEDIAGPFDHRLAWIVRPCLGGFLPLRFRLGSRLSFPNPVLCPDSFRITLAVNSLSCLIGYGHFSRYGHIYFCSSRQNGLGLRMNVRLDSFNCMGERVITIPFAPSKSALSTGKVSGTDPASAPFQWGL